MIKKQHRLRKNRYFRYIYNHGETKSTKCIALTFLKTKFKPFKVGFSVSKKIGKSVVRNKVKRRMRAVFNLLENNFNKNYNYIFTAKIGIQNLSFNEIKMQMCEALKKNGLYVENN